MDMWRGTAISDDAFYSILGIQGTDSEQFHKTVRGLSSARGLIHFRPDEAVTSLKKHAGRESIERILRSADKVVSHEFDLLGSGPVTVKYGMAAKGIDGCKYHVPADEPEIDNASEGYMPIDWHIDFKSGFRWDATAWYKKIRYGHKPGVDVKVPWELSRFQHLATLGQAWWITKHEKYSREFTDQIVDWIENNPPKFGVNWVCTMDVAIRAVNWIIGFDFFISNTTLSNDFWMKFLKSLFLHGRFIRSNLEIGTNERGERITSNHYLSNVVGLICIGNFFGKTQEGKEWLEFGVAEMLKEMEIQVHPDGVDFESSIPYHRLVLELFVTAAIQCKKGGINLPERFWKRLEKMFEFTMYYTKPDGKAPQIGDNDNGRLWILSDYGDWDINDHRYLLSLGAALFNRKDFSEAAGRHHNETFWLCGEQGSDMVHQTAQTLKSRTFPDSGYYIMRDNNDYMIISSGKVGTNGIGNHKHNDIFSFELCAQGESFIIDPGTYVYTPIPKMRNLFRSTAFHNTALIDGEEMNHFEGKDLFTVTDQSFPNVLKWESNSDQDVFIGEHTGYEKLKDPVKHKRQIMFSKKNKCWHVTDYLEGNASHTVSLNFHIAPHVKIEQHFTDEEILTALSHRDIRKVRIDKNNVLKLNGAKSGLIIIMENTQKLQLLTSTAFGSESYGIVCKCSLISIQGTIRLPCEISYFLISQDQ
jgi:uncharacterized heparinase superfamily protein